MDVNRKLAVEKEKSRELTEQLKNLQLQLRYAPAPSEKLSADLATIRLNLKRAREMSHLEVKLVKMTSQIGGEI